MSLSSRFKKIIFASFLCIVILGGLYFGLREIKRRQSSNIFDLAEQKTPTVLSDFLGVPFYPGAKQEGEIISSADGTIPVRAVYSTTDNLSKVKTFYQNFIPEFSPMFEDEKEFVSQPQISSPKVQTQISLRQEDKKTVIVYESF